MRFILHPFSIVNTFLQKKIIFFLYCIKYLILRILNIVDIYVENYFLPHNTIFKNLR